MHPHTRTHIHWILCCYNYWIGWHGVGWVGSEHSGCSTAKTILLYNTKFSDAHTSQYFISSYDIIYGNQY